MSVVLLGYRGSGKTTVGKKLAARLWQSFVDTDALVTKAAGKTIAEIFATDGEPRFRDLEEQAVLDALALQDHVISLGGGAVLREATRDRLKASGRKRIYLRCDPQVLSQRIAADPHSATNRPTLTAGGASPSDVGEIERLLALREPLYRDVMTSELDVTNLSVDEAVVYIVRLM